MEYEPSPMSLDRLVMYILIHSLLPGKYYHFLVRFEYRNKGQRKSKLVKRSEPIVRDKVRKGVNNRRTFIFLESIKKIKIQEQWAMERTNNWTWRIKWVQEQSRCFWMTSVPIVVVVEVFFQFL